MICRRCHRPITSPTWIAGHPYGSDCAKQLTGHATTHPHHSTRRTTHDHDDSQPDLFQNQNLEKMDAAGG